MGDVIKWIDLSKIGLHLGSYKDATGQSGLAIIDESGKYDAQIRELGFKPSTQVFGKGIYLKEDYAVTAPMLRAAFGPDAVNYFVAERTEIYRRFNARVKEITKTNSTALFAQQRPIGLNSNGEVVQESIIGRYIIRDADGKPVIVKETPKDAALFLRAKTLDDLREVCSGFVRRITVRNESLRREHVQRLMDVSNEGEFTPRQYQEAIESAINGLFAEELASAYVKGDDADPLSSFDVANKLYVGMPELKERTASSMANQQYSTPVPMSALAQALVARRAELHGASVLEPTIGNASLVSVLNVGVDAANRCHIYGVELDPARVEQVIAAGLADEVILGDATKIDFRRQFSKPQGFDFVIANPPFGSLDDKVDVHLPDGSAVRTIQTARLDHLILLDSLHARNEEGRAVFITGADSALGNGEIKGRSKHLLAYLYDHYEVDGVVEVAGELYKKQGAAYPLRMYVIGSRRAAPIQAEMPESLPVIRTYEGLREWAAEVIAKQKSLAFDIRDLTGESKESSEPSGIEKNASVSDAGSGALPKEDVRQESEFQQRYIAFSNVGEASTMIPANLSGPVYEALAQIKELHGDIDEYVARELDYSIADLGTYFSPEQVDTLGMIFHAHSRDLGFLVAHQMGVGKGRILAGVARRERLQGRIPMFVTITPNLFSDFLERDIAAIGSRDLFKNPLIVNDNCKTVDDNGDVVVKALKRPEYRRYAEAGTLPEGTDLILLTYSQISRQPTAHLTSRYMRELAHAYPITLLLDESHNGAGASNVGDNLEAMIEATGGRGKVVYSSGTPIKGAANLRLYKKILPKGVDTEELLNAVKSDPLSLQEALNYEIAAQGCLISCELDNTGIDKEFVISEDIERNRRIADQMADILSAMNYLSGDISKVVGKINREFQKELEKVPEEERTGNRMGATSMNFGSRMHELNRQFLLALKASDVVLYAQRALEANKKPIIALQHTGESLLTDFVTRANEVYENDPQRVQKESNAIVIERPVTFKDLMLKYLEKIQWIKVQGRYGDVSYQQADSKEIQHAIERIEGLIKELPDDLPLTPIDYVREKMAELGYSVGEVSGRNLMARTLENGAMSIEPVPGRTDKTRVNRVVREFNNGDIDVLMLTASGSTGLSAQASPAVGSDVRARRMIKWEMQPNIASERQMDGRHNRTGQIVPPEYCIPMTGLPADDRLVMMFNNKNRSLTASTVANRDSKEIIREVPDLLNVVGDMAAEEMLYERPDLAAHLDIELPKDSDERAEKPPLWYSGKLSGRISMLKVHEQEALYADWQARFVEKLDKLKAEGRNPLEVECHDWKARVVDREVFMGAEAKDATAKKSTFNSPVYLTSLEYEQTVKAVKADAIDTKISEEGKDVSMFMEESATKTIVNHIQKNRQSILERNLSQRFESVEAALNSKDSNEVQNTQRKLQWLERNLPSLGRGTIFMKDDLEGKPVPHVILSYNLPGKMEGWTRLSDYVAYAMQPGSDVVTMHTFSSLYSEDVDFEYDKFADHAIVRAEFDNAQDGVITKRAHVLDGNLFEATITNLREKIGRKIVYTDATGARQHGILLRTGLSVKKLMEIPERVRDVRLLQEIAAGGHPVTTHHKGDWKLADGDFVLGKTQNGQWTVQVSDKKIHGGHIFLDPVISLITGKEKECKFNLHFSAARGKMMATMRQEQVGDLLEYLIEKKNLTFYMKDRALLKSARDRLEGIYEPVAAVA